MSRREIRQRAKQISEVHGYLPYMVERYLALWGEEETLRFIEACERPVKRAIRVNTLLTTADEVVGRLTKKGVVLTQVPWLEEGYLAEFGDVSPGALFEYMWGYYYVQSVPSMTAVHILDPRPGEVVMDLAAAPGGKTTHIAQRMHNTGLVVAMDTDEQRIGALRGNLARCGVNNTVVLRGDARRVGRLGISPDRILLDAPCSGEGLIPRDPSRKTSKSMADIRYCATRQDEMLDAALGALRPGGILVYATCSIAPEEDEFVVDGILRRRDDVVLEEVGSAFGIPAYTSPYGVQLDSTIARARRFLPHTDGTEGFFICKIRKEE